jgi:hypothetical protein
MPRTDSSAAAHGGQSAWIGGFHRFLSSDFEDERQEAVWNKAAASALSLTWLAILVADLVFVLIDYDRYASVSFVSFMIASGGLVYAQLKAGRQGVRPRVRVPSWPAMALGSVLFGTLFFFLTRAMDHGGDWRTRAISSAAVAVFWGIAMRVTLKRKHDRALRANRTP